MKVLREVKANGGRDIHQYAATASAKEFRQIYLERYMGDDLTYTVEPQKSTVLTPFLIRDNKGRTPLHYAVRFGNQDLIQFLLDNNPENYINIADHHGMTPFYWGCHQLCQETDDLQFTNLAVALISKPFLNTSIHSSLNKIIAGKTALQMLGENLLQNQLSEHKKNLFAKVMAVLIMSGANDFYLSDSIRKELKTRCDALSLPLKPLHSWIVVSYWKPRCGKPGHVALEMAPIYVSLYQSINGSIEFREKEQDENAQFGAADESLVLFSLDTHIIFDFLHEIATVQDEINYSFLQKKINDYKINCCTLILQLLKKGDVNNILKLPDIKKGFLLPEELFAQLKQAAEKEHQIRVIDKNMIPQDLRASLATSDNIRAKFQTSDINSAHVATFGFVRNAVKMYNLFTSATYHSKEKHDEDTGRECCITGTNP